MGRIFRSVLCFGFALFLFAGCETVSVDPSPTAAPPASKEAVQSAIRAHLGDVRDCYEAALKFDPTEQGEVMLKLTIGEKGQVTNAETDPAKTTLRDPNLAQCLCDKAKAWPFPPPAAGTSEEIRYPFLFAKNVKAAQPLVPRGTQLVAPVMSAPSAPPAQAKPTPVQQ